MGNGENDDVRWRLTGSLLGSGPAENDGADLAETLQVRPARGSADDDSPRAGDDLGGHFDQPRTPRAGTAGAPGVPVKSRPQFLGLFVREMVMAIGTEERHFGFRMTRAK